ncbi:hypothetical protein [Methylobacterium haplocladii]|uniref:Uncharacterized protein n=1 Tax=Methylobacterium haplocladii TaxID=1176176 RepID=A0A512IRD5_9HYPH|nr:hypothetical protein [Methylobacterium haplocladii]GEP00270.1 hypothetical protein MHA02_26570 [Methylobacterium haplocladii]GJD84222.1 hypothetical protein HPGCJGGD_2097 [Methylobacterium haplocladii]GLS60403.1 hypothetical protein GCM10007887_30820 [Methylobacterium haplocladii]
MRTFIALLLALLCGTAQAQDAAKSEAELCASFDWPLAREAAWFSAPDLPVLASGSSLPADRPAASLTLKPSTEAGLPLAPSRAPKPGTFAGFVRLAAPAAPGQVQVTLSGEGWIDVAEAGGAVLKPGAHSGRKGCGSLRKSVRFSVGAKPLVVSVSNATVETIRIAVTPVD